MSRWARWSPGPVKTLSFDSFLKEQQSPAEMAQSMGLQSDGSGGYVDETGQVVARTVNNELVFYDPMGGAISAQSDGAELTQDQPSWVDPITGEITVPPGKPESPEEIATVPDPVPAQAPAGYSAFMNKKKKEAYANQTTPEDAVDNVEAEEEDPEMGFPDPGPQTEGYSPEDLAKSTNPTPKPTMGQRVQANRKNFSSFSQKPQQTQQPQKPVQTSGDTVTQPLDTAPKPQVAQAKQDQEIASAPKSPLPSHDNIAERGQESRQENSKLFETVTGELKKKYKSQRKIDESMQQYYEPLSKLLSEIEDPTARDRQTEAFINAMSSGSRVNHGSNALSGKQYQGLSDRRSMLEGLDIDDEGVRDFDRIRNFKKDQIQYDDISDDYVNATYGLLPDAVKSSLRHTSRAGLDDESFAALQERFPLAQVMGSGKNRRLDYSPIFWKQYLETGGRDAYTGELLDINDLNIEHMIPGSDGAKDQELYDWVEDPDNKVLVHRAPNQIRGNSTLKNFLEETLKDYNPASNDLYDFIADATDGLQGSKSRARDLDITNLSDLMLDFGEDGEQEGIFNPDLDEDQYQVLQSQHQKQYDQLKDSVLQAIQDKFDPDGDGHYKLTPKKLEQKIEELGLDENAAHRLRTLSKVFGKANSLTPDFGKTMRNMRLGTRETGKILPTNPRTDPSHGGTTTGSSENREMMEKLFRNSLFGKDRETQESRKRMWNDSIEAGSNASRLADKETDIEPEYFRRRERTQFLGLQAFHKSLMESGFLDDGVLDADEYRALKADMDYHSGTSIDDHLALYDTQDDKMSKGKLSGKKTGWLAKHLESLMSESFENIDFDDEKDDLMTDMSPLDKLLHALSQLMDTEGGMSRESPRLNFESFRARIRK